MSHSRTLLITALLTLLWGCQDSNDSMDDATVSTAPETTEALTEVDEASVAEDEEMAAETLSISKEVRQAAETIDGDELMAHIQTLSSDEFAGRAPGTVGEELTLAFLEEHATRLGLDPLFGDSYTQPVELVAITAAPDADVTFTPPEGEPWTLSYGPEAVVGTTRVMDSAGLEDSELVFVGYGIVAPEYDWNDYEGIDMSGKTAVILVNDPGFATEDADLFSGRAMTYYGRWTYKYEEAARQGAEGAIIVHETAPASYGWNVVQNSWTGPQFHLQTDDNNMGNVAIEGWIQRNQAEKLMQAAGHDFEALKTAALENDTFDAVPLGITATTSVSNSIERKTSYNFGAMVKGTERPDELFIYTAHWDHLGVDESLEGEDKVYNGAKDNATGTAALIQLGEAFKALPEAPARSIGFLAVTAEESGLLGSRHYANKPPIPMSQTVGGVNLDAMGVYGPTKDIVVVGYGSSELEEVLKDYAETQDRLVVPEGTPEAGYYYRSDHFNFAKKGVPMLYAEAGTNHLEKPKSYIEDLDRDYVENRYHGVEDEITEAWDLRGMVQDLRLFFMIGADVANSSSWPNWYQGNEFRAIRDESRSQED